MPLSNRCRQLSVAPVAHLERQGRGSLGSGSSAGRIQNSFPEGSRFIQGTHPFSGLLSQLHPGQGLGAGSGVSASERSYRTKSTSFPGLLQLAFCNDEGLRVVATHHRPLSLEPHGVKNTVQDGYSSVHPLVCLQGGLDGLHRPPGCISTDSSPSGIPEVSAVHGIREGLPIQDSLFWSSHGATSLHAGHGSGFGNSSQSWHSAPPISGRLADSGVPSRAGSPVFEDSSSALQLSGDRRQLGEISACSDSNHLLSGGHTGFHQFPGFSSPETDRQAALNWRRISVLRGTACKILAGVARSAVLFNSAHSGGTAEDAVVPVSPQPQLESGRSRRASSVVSGGPPGPALVASPRVPRMRNLTRASVPSARLMVQRLGCRLGGAPRRSGRFRPLVSCRIAQLHQPSGAKGNILCSSTFSSSSPQHRRGGVCGQYHGSGLPTASGWNKVGDAQPDSAGASAVGGGPLYHASATVHHGAQQCVGGRAFSPESNPGLRMDPKNLGLQSAPHEVASYDRPICNISKLPLYTIFFSLPRSQFHRDGGLSPTVGWMADVCLSALCSNFGGFEEAPLILWGPSDDRSSLLATEAVVSRAPGVSGRWFGGSASGPRSVEPATYPSSTSGSVKASSSCLETIQRFLKSCGFYRHVAKQTALARRPSSRAGYQAKWSVYRKWCTSEGHSISRPSLPKIVDFLFWLRRSKHLSVSAVRGYRSMLSAVFRSVLPEISTSLVLQDLLSSFSVEAPVRSATPPSWDLLKVLEYLKSPVFEPLHQASLRDLTRKTLFLTALASA